MTGSDTFDPSTPEGDSNPVSDSLSGEKRLEPGIRASESRGTQTQATVDDVRFVQAVVRGDRKATAEFVERYSDILYTYLSGRLFPRTDLVDDYLQEVFIAAWESLERFEGRSPLRSWMLGIARHKVEGHYRKVLREPDALETEDGEPDGMPTEAPAAEEWIDHHRRHDRTREVLEALPEMYRAALLWRYWDRRSTAEMAEITGKTSKAMERILARAREQFRRRWNDD